MSAAPTSTTNMTGFFGSVTGFSLTNDCLGRRSDDLRIEQRPRPAQLLRHQRSRIVLRGVLLEFQVLQLVLT